MPRRRHKPRDRPQLGRRARAAKIVVAGAAGVELSYAQLVRLLGGLDLTTGRRRKRYRRRA